MQLPPSHSPHSHDGDDDDDDDDDNNDDDNNDVDDDDDDNDDDDLSHLVLLIHVNSMIDKESEKRRKQQYNIFQHFNIHHNIHHNNHENYPKFNQKDHLMTGAWPCLAAQ